MRVTYLRVFYSNFTGSQSTECFQLVSIIIFLNHFETLRSGHEPEQLQSSRSFREKNDV